MRRQLVIARGLLRYRDRERSGKGGQARDRSAYRKRRRAFCPASWI